MKSMRCRFLPAIAICAFASAQEMPFRVQLNSPLSTATSHKGDVFTARVLSPEAFRGDTVQGRITDVKSGNKLHGEAVLNFTFDSLLHGGTTVPISSAVTSLSNSKGQANVDEEGRVVRKSSNVGKALAGTGAGALVGGLLHGAKGAAIGAGVGAAASLMLIEVAAQGPRIDFGAGSEIGLSVKSRGGPALASLPRNSPAPPAPAPATIASANPAPEPAPEPQPAPAAADEKATTAASSDQPQLSAVKIDFIPGEKVIFYDDFSDMAEDEPPPHWKLRDGKVELRTGGGIRQLTGVCPVKLSLHSQSFTFPKNFTVEIEAAFGADGPSMDFYAWPKDVDGGEAPTWHIRIAPNEVAMEGPKGDKIGNQPLNPHAVNTPIKVALWVQDGRARGYVGDERFADVNQMFVPADMKPADHWTVRERCDRASEGWVGIRSVRVAESAPDFSTVISSTGRYVTHGITFDTDSDRLKPESAPVLKAIVRGLQKNPNLKLAIVGYTDSTGDAQHNMDLSKRRAEAVRSVLVAQFNVDASRLTASGLGAEKPIASNDTAEGRAQNRRVEFVKQ